MKKYNSKDNPLFIPDKLILPARALESRQGLLCSIKAYDELVPMLLLRLTPQEIDFFGIGPRDFPCNRNLRYLDYADDEMIEIVLRLKWRRLLHVDMDPGAGDCRRFLELCLKTGSMAAGFYCPESQLLAATCWHWDDDEIGWLDRNHARAKCLKKNNFEAVSKVHHGHKKEKICVVTSQEGLFLNQDDHLVPFMKVVDIS